jgi:hypothetical protein
VVAVDLVDLLRRTPLPRRCGDGGVGSEDGDEREQQRASESPHLLS